MADKQLREAVIDAMAAVGYAAGKRDDDPWDAIESAFPGTPTDVVAMAYIKATDIATEEWWRRVEATIDGEAIRIAVVTISEDGGG